MAVSIQEVEHVAALARLAFTDDEKAALTGQLNDILRYMEQLNALNTDGVEPLSEVIALSNVFRDDTRQASLPRAEALQNAPARTEEFFRVPKVLDNR